MLQIFMFRGSSGLRSRLRSFVRIFVLKLIVSSLVQGMKPTCDVMSGRQKKPSPLPLLWLDCTHHIIWATICFYLFLTCTCRKFFTAAAQMKKLAGFLLLWNMCCTKHIHLVRVVIAGSIPNRADWCCLGLCTCMFSTCSLWPLTSQSQAPFSFSFSLSVFFFSLVNGCSVLSCSDWPTAQLGHKVAFTQRMNGVQCDTWTHGALLSVM